MNPQTLKEYIVVMRHDAVPSIWTRSQWRDYLKNCEETGHPNTKETGYYILATFNASDELKDSPYQAGSAVTILMDIDSQTIREVYFDKDKAIEACRANRDLAPFTFPVLDAISPAGDGWKEHAIEFADWLAEMTEVIKESKIALYRYCNGMNEWGNYTLDDIYLEFLEHLKRTPSPSNKRV